MEYKHARGADDARLQEVAGRIGPLDQTAQFEARRRQDELTKPPGSLGRLERLATQIAGITGNARPRLPRKAVIVVSGDHGVTVEDVSAYPSEVTGQMVRNFAQGGAAINVLARGAGARVVVGTLACSSHYRQRYPFFIERSPPERPIWRSVQL